MNIAIIAIVCGSAIIIIKTVFSFIENKNTKTANDDIINELQSIINRLETRVQVLESLIVDKR